MSPSIKQILIWSLLFAASSVQGVALEDPRNLANGLKQDFPETTSAPFNCNQPTQFLQTISNCRMSCVVNKCHQECQQSPPKPFLVQAVDCETPVVHIVSSLAWTARVAQKSTLKYGQTWIEELVRSMDFFIEPLGAMEIFWVIPNEVRKWVDEYGGTHEIMTTRILLTYRQTPALSGTYLDLILWPEQRGLDQLLYFGFRGNKRYFFKRWGFL